MVLVGTEVFLPSMDKFVIFYRAQTNSEFSTEDGHIPNFLQSTDKFRNFYRGQTGGPMDERTQKSLMEVNGTHLKKTKKNWNDGNNNGKQRIATPPQVAHVKPPGPIRGIPEEI